MSDLSGKTLGQYQVIKSIGQGGMAKIYLAYQPSIKREVAIKVLASDLQENASFVNRFAKEVEVIAHLQHPQIIPVYDFGKQDDELYIVMAYMRGLTLAERIDNAPKGLPDKETIRLMDLICEGLDYAHSKGVVHRDLKPNNILMDENNHPYIADFGLAKLSEGKLELTNTMMTGTAAYMAPEIAQSGKSTKRADIYALGIILFEMLTGRLPFQGETPYKMLSAHINKPVPNIRKFRPDLPQAVQAVLEKTLAKNPVNRFDTAGQMIADFKAAMSTSSSRLNTGWLNRGQILLQSPRFWMIAITLAALSGTLILTSRLKKDNGSAAHFDDPTEHIAQILTTSTGNTQWTYDCLGNSNSALVDLDCTEIKIAVENRILPYNYIFLDTNQPGGMDYDMWWEICSRLHCKPVFIEQKWETMLDKIRIGEYDAASEGITITEERRENLDFSVSYLNIEQLLVVRKGETRFSDIGEFHANEKLIAGALENSTNLDAAKKYIPENRIKTYKEYSSVFYALATGDIDAAIADQVQGQSTVSGIDLQQAIKLEFIGTSLSSDQFAVVFPEGSNLVEPVNKAIQDMRVQGILDELIARYFGPSFTLTYNDIDLGAHRQSPSP
ncbi:MAG TPA: transporter substrate-binding domain-containing protein [Anaerolineales bacterium]|nr:transporter substrate-binding domain-containing protein [Anaerolineales bacterium]